MHDSDQITVQLLYLYDHKSLTLHWRSVWKLGSHHVASSYADTGDQYVGYAYQ